MKPLRNTMTLPLPPPHRAQRTALTRWSKSWHNSPRTLQCKTLRLQANDSHPSTNIEAPRLSTCWSKALASPFCAGDNLAKNTGCAPCFWSLNQWNANSVSRGTKVAAGTSIMHSSTRQWNVPALSDKKTCGTSVVLARVERATVSNGHVWWDVRQWSHVLNVIHVECT